MSSGARQGSFYGETGWVVLPEENAFVACGNFVPTDESLPDLFAAGLHASSLRTDIRQAFVLAPWVGGPVAIQPPTIATSLGLCAPDDFWPVKKSLYGVREAPSVWAQFRDSVLRNVTWRTTIDGSEHNCVLR